MGGWHEGVDNWVGQSPLRRWVILRAPCHGREGGTPRFPEYQQAEEMGSKWRAGERAVQSGAVTGIGEVLPKGPFLSPNYNL